MRKEGQHNAGAGPGTTEICASETPRQPLSYRLPHTNASRSTRIVQDDRHPPVQQAVPQNPVSPAAQQVSTLIHIDQDGNEHLPPYADGEADLAGKTAPNGLTGRRPEGRANQLGTELVMPGPNNQQGLPADIDEMIQKVTLHEQAGSVRSGDQCDQKPPEKCADENDVRCQEEPVAPAQGIPKGIKHNDRLCQNGPLGLGRKMLQDAAFQNDRPGGSLPEKLPTRTIRRKQCWE